MTALLILVPVNLVTAVEFISWTAIAIQALLLARQLWRLR